MVCDVLDDSVHVDFDLDTAGDMTNQGTLKELKTTMGWINRAMHEVKIVIAGKRHFEWALNQTEDCAS